MIFKILFCHSKFYFDIIRSKSENRILTFEICFDIRTASEIVFWHSKSYFDIRTKSENHILTFVILFSHSNWVGKCYFDIQNPILTFELCRKIVFWHSKSLFWHSNQSENRYFDILILTFELSRKIVFWHSKSYYDIRT